MHVVTGATVDGDVLKVYFDHGEVLTVVAPEGAKVGGDIFRIIRASRVKWELFLYGMPQAPLNSRFLEFTASESGFRVQTNLDWPNAYQNPSSQFPAVEIL